MIRYFIWGLIVAIAALFVSGISQANTRIASAESEFGVLVPGKGAEETYSYCIACHSEKIVAQQGLPRDGWIKLLEWMIEEQGMPKIDEPDYSLIIDYLAKNYNIDRPNFPR
jgi:cytochrome c